MLENSIFSEGQGVASSVYVEGNDVGERDYVRQELQKMMWKGMGGGGEGGLLAQRRSSPFNMRMRIWGTTHSGRLLIRGSDHK